MSACLIAGSGLIVVGQVQDHQLRSKTNRWDAEVRRSIFLSRGVRGGEGCCWMVLGGNAEQFPLKRGNFYDFAA